MGICMCKEEIIQEVDESQNEITEEETLEEELEEVEPQQVEPKEIIKKALLIGINYTGSDNELYGCINDSENLKDFLIKKKFFKNEELIFMNDNAAPDLYPTKANIEKQLLDLVKFAEENLDKDIKLFLSYSGHGYYVKDKNGDEKDGHDEVLCPVDFESGGFIVDDYLKKNFVDKLPENVSIVFLIDSCHSGTMLDLRYNYKDLKQKYVHELNSETTCRLVMISGCRDNETSMDAEIFDDNEERYEYQGAMTAGFIKKYQKNITYGELITDMRKYLIKDKFTQVPQLSSGKSIDLSQEFILNSYL